LFSNAEDSSAGAHGPSAWDPTPAELIAAKNSLDRKNKKQSADTKRTEALKRWRAIRKKDPLLRVLRCSRRGPAVCACGQRKPLSEKYCYACGDARKVIAKKYGCNIHDAESRAQTRQRLQEMSRIERQQIPTTTPRKTPWYSAADDTNESFDDIVKLYEENNG
jgi:hypothetical protein